MTDLKGNTGRRAFDMEAHENNGVPHDEGWAACSVESGRTVGEMLMGLQVYDTALNLAAPISRFHMSINNRS